jgi:DNA-binding GntR family transcriptional regulator
MEADFCAQCNAFLYTTATGSDYRSPDDPPPTALAPSMSSTADTIHARIYDAIVEQRLPPGTKLGEESLCEIFGVGRTLIRRVLQRLANEHVVESRPHRGACVARPSVEEAREVFEARRALEAHVIDRLVSGLTPGAALRLRRHVAEEREAHAAGDRRRLIRRSGEFHLLLAELAGNRAIARFLRELVSRTSLIIAVYEAPGESCCSFDDHAAIIEALASGRAQVADQAMRTHLSGIERRLRLDRLPERTVDLQEALAAGRRGSRFASRRARAADVLAPGD